MGNYPSNQGVAALATAEKDSPTAQAVKALANNANGQIGSDQLAKVLSSATTVLSSSSGVLNAVTFGKYVDVLTLGLGLGKTETLDSNDAKGIINELGGISERLGSIDMNSSTSASLQYQSDFGRLVHAFVAQEIERAESDADETRLAVGTEEQTTVSTTTAKNLFIVFHPADDWWPLFRKELLHEPLEQFLGTCTNLEALGPYLSEVRERYGPEPVFHILLPSAHEYILPREIIVPSHLSPMKITGQTRHKDGQPYVHATLTGLELSNIKGVHSLPRPAGSKDSKGGFSSTSHNIRFEPPASLLANCRGYNGKPMKSQLNLDKLLGVEDGSFVINGKDFSKMATNVSIDTIGGAATLRCTIFRKAGGTKEAAINLDSFISNRGGKLMKYGMLSGIQTAGSGVAGTVAGIAGGVVGAVLGPVGAIAGAGLAAGYVGSAVDEHQRELVR